MKLTNEFTIPLDVEATWNLLTNIEKVAGCMPGAELTSINGNNFKGFIKIKVGPINALFEGTAVLEKNTATRTAIITVNGADRNGQGFAKGTITASVVQAGHLSLVRFDTDVTVTGRMASFGRSTMADISDKLFAQFEACIKEALYAS